MSAPVSPSHRTPWSYYLKTSLRGRISREAGMAEDREQDAEVAEAAPSDDADVQAAPAPVDSTSRSSAPVAPVDSPAPSPAAEPDEPFEAAFADEVPPVDLVERVPSEDAAPRFAAQVEEGGQVVAAPASPEAIGVDTSGVVYPPVHHDDGTLCGAACPVHPDLETLQAVLAWEALNPRDPETGKFLPVSSDESSTAESVPVEESA